MRVVCFYPTYNTKQAMVLSCFARGVGADLVPLQSAQSVDCDIAVVFGWYKYAYKPTMAKKPIIERQLAKGPKHLIVIESGFYYRGVLYQIGWDGFAGMADFCNANSPGDRALRPPILAPWKHHKGRDVVICGQVLRDTQVQDVDHAQWCRDQVTLFNQAIKDFKGKNRLFFRPHPREYVDAYGVDSKYHDTRKIFRSLKRAKLVVTYNSTSCIDALAAGVKTIAHHHSSILSQAGDWPGDDEDAGLPVLYEWRQQFFNNLGYAMWNLDEMAKGKPWEHLTRSL